MDKNLKWLLVDYNGLMRELLELQVKMDVKNLLIFKKISKNYHSIKFHCLMRSVEGSGLLNITFTLVDRIQIIQ